MNLVNIDEESKELVPTLHDDQQLLAVDTMGSIIEHKVDDLAFDEDPTVKTAIAPAMRKATVKQVAGVPEFDLSTERMSERNTNRANTTKNAGN